MNVIMAEQTTCAKCGVALGDNASEGLCPRCLFQVILTPELDEPEPRLAGDSALGKVRYFGDYEIVSEIAHGGMGVVFRARQVSLKRDVALKMLLAGLFASRNFVHRFCTEAEAAAKLDHPNIVPIYEIGQHEGQHYFSMKLIDGFSLAKELQGKPWEIKRAAEFMAKVARAVHYAHQRGILHRDIKPGNILLDSKGEPHVTDFGLAKIAESETNVTQTDAVMGSPAYMSPEQAAGQTKNLTTASDVYSLGAVFYELLTGRPPFQGESALDVMRQVAGREPISPRTIHAHIDRDLETICLKCLEKDAPRRYSSAEALADDLERWLRCEPILGRPSSTWNRTSKWVRRKPAVAAFTLVTGVLTVILAIVSPIAAFRINHERQRAEENRQRAEENQQRADQNLYDSDMSLAQHAWNDGDLGLALSRLQAHLPRTGETDRRDFEWFYFWNLCKGEQRLTLTNHTQTVNAVAFSPDGKRLATGSVGNPVQIWDTANEKIVKTLPEQHVVSLAFAPDGQTLGVGGRDKVVVWNLETERAVFKHEGALGQFRIAFSPVGSLLVIGKRDGPMEYDGGSAELWDYVTRERKQVFPESGGQVALAARGDRLATANWNRATTKIWDLASGQFVRSLKTGGVIAMALSPDGQSLATSYWRPEVKLWDVATGQQSGSLPITPHRVWGLAFSPDGRSLATGGADQMVRLWDVPTRQQTEQLQGHGGEVMSVAFSTDGQALASGSKDKKAMLWSVHPNRAATTVSNVISGDFVPGFPGAIFSPDGRLLAGGIDQCAVVLWDVATLRLKGVFAGACDAVAFSSDGTALVTRGTNYFLRTFDVATQTPRETIPGRPVEGYAALSPDGQILAVGSSHGTITFFDAKTGVRMATNAHAFASDFMLAFSPNGKLLASAGIQFESEEPAPKIWDTTTHKMVAAPAGHTDLIIVAAFTPDGKTLVTCGADDSIKFWDTTTWKEIPPSLGHKEYVSALALSPNGRRLATVCSDGTMKIWNVATRRELASLKLGLYGLLIRFSPDGQTLLAGDGGATLRLWRAPVLPDKKQSRPPDD
jgi:eukaryotic-like serine/threonine-protein kinase